MNKSLSVLQISTLDFGGGAEKVAFNLFNEYKKRSIESKLAVGFKNSQDPDVLIIDNYQNKKLTRLTNHFLNKISAVKYIRSLNRYEKWFLNPKSSYHEWVGHEKRDYPGIRNLISKYKLEPDIIHCHNLHGGYFDLNYLPKLSQKYPVILTLHDSWMLTGHCAHSFDCERWIIGCGQCPYLKVYPAISRDGSHWNWERKRKILEKSSVFVVTPCNWLLNRIKRSPFSPFLNNNAVIPYGVNLEIFYPNKSLALRRSMGYDSNEILILFSAQGIKNNIWKDYDTMRRSIELLAKKNINEKVRFLALGDFGPEEKISDNIKVEFIPFLLDHRKVSHYNQIADIYIHAAKIDTFPNAILEALACGTPVVATSVGGIPEQIKPGKTGFLSPPGDPYSMCEFLELLIQDGSLLKKMSESASMDAKENFSQEKQVNAYLSLYKKCMN